MTLSKVISNNLYALNLIRKNCFGLVFYKLFTSILRAGIYVMDLYFLRYAVNIVQNHGQYRDAVTILLALCMVYLVYETLLAALSAKLEPYFTYRLNANLKRMTLQKTTECELACYENPEFYNQYTLAMAQASDKVSRILDSISQLLRSIVSLLGAGVLAFLIDPLVFLFALLPFLLTGLRKKRGKLNYEMNKELSVLNRRKAYAVRTFYSVDYAKEMRLTNISEPILMRFKNAVDEAIAVYKNYGMKLAFSWILDTVIGSIFSQYLILLYAAFQTLVTGNMMYGDCLVAVNTVETVYYAIDEIAAGTMQFHEQALYIENLRHFMEYEPTIRNNANAPKAEIGDIELDHVSFRYPGMNTDILHDLSMTIRKGEKIAIVGHNGAGKTTLTKLLLRLYDPTEGSIKVNRQDLRSLNLDSVRDLFAVVLQDYRHFSMSVSENILMRKMRTGDEALVRSAIENSGLAERVTKMPDGVNSILEREFDENGVILSGGESQKLAIAHVYAKNSPIVILDEPSSALDPIAEAELYETMFRICRDRTVISISHRMASAKMADRIFFLENGTIAESGTHTELMERNGKYAELYRVQAANYAKEERAV